MATPDLHSARWLKSSYSNGNGGACVELALLDWRKSSYSNGDGGACVELAQWRKSSYSNGNGGDCVELSVQPVLTAVRDSKNPDGDVLLFPASAFAGFLTSVKAGRL